MIRKTVHLATKLTSFESAANSVCETLEISLTTKRVERLTERVGGERVAERDLSIAEWQALPLMQKLAAPPGVKAPAVVCVTCDGGRLQRCDLPETAKSHWCETKVGALLELQPNPQASDPCPQVPDKFLDLTKMDELSREIKGAVPKGSVFQKADAWPTGSAVAAAAPAECPTDPPASPACGTNRPGTSSVSAERADVVAAARKEVVAEPPVVQSRDVIASLVDSERFGGQLAAAAWALGFAAATLKAFIADGQAANWGIWKREFKHLGFVPILDFIHALTYVFAAAMAGRSRVQGSPIYIRWITWVWQGEVTRVIAELAARAVELGTPPADAAETDPRQIVADTLTYLTNQQSRMNYPAYRRMGLPITSSHIESTIKQMNQRVKGSEKFWTQAGGESLLQLRADQLSDTAPLDVFWTRRASQATGTRKYQSKPRKVA
ncbi:MAG: hypothetical protein HY000_17785 [Planctomycetes bacterium]|nr:hypothetical protein [Planctomycetota bacterium]